MPIISRVAASAQLNIPGTYVQKTAEAFKRRDAFLRDAFAVMKKDGEISREDFDCTLGHHLPGVDCSVVPTKSWFYDGGVNYDFTDDAGIRGFTVELPFINGALSWCKKTKETLVHETTHLFEMLANPKISARDAAWVEKMKDPAFIKRSEKYGSFYDNSLYKCDKKLFAMTRRRCTSLPKEEYNSNLKERMDDLKEQIKQMFIDNNASQSERIDVLQSYRNDLRLEYNARKAEVDYAFDNTEAIRSEKDLRNYFYLEKLQVVEGLLASVLRENRG